MNRLTSLRTFYCFAFTASAAARPANSCLKFPLLRIAAWRHHLQLKITLNTLILRLSIAIYFVVKVNVSSAAVTINIIFFPDTLKTRYISAVLRLLGIAN